MAALLESHAAHEDGFFQPTLEVHQPHLAEIVAACPHNGIVLDKDNPENLHMHFEECNQCGRCLRVAPEGSLKLQAVNFHSFQEACAIAVDVVLSTFEPGKAVHLYLA